MIETRIAGSFRDPAGHVFLRDGLVYRRIEPAGVPSYRRLIESGLYAALVAERLLIPHDDLGADPERPGTLVLRPRQLPMVSYPYEWSLSQLRDAALVTLRAQRAALREGMVLKDASAFNVQFIDGHAILIDTLSFEPYAGGPWVAYRQFCQHFYAPLLVAASRDASLVRLASLYLDGLPLPTASQLLPRSSYLQTGPLFHVHLHARAEQRWAQSKAAAMPKPEAKASTSTRAIEVLTDSLQRAVTAVTWSARGHWAGYYAEGESYSSDTFARKAQVVGEWLDRVKPGRVFDLGANTGYFSKLAAQRGAFAVAFDSDASCVDTLYREVRDQKIGNVLPLLLDLANPTPSIGWAGQERMSLAGRGPADLLLALAVTHHLAIGNNVPFTAMAEYFASLGRNLIVEFVPKTDPMVGRMLRDRADVFPDYSPSAFEAAFASCFTIEDRTGLAPSGRVLYLLRRHDR